MRTPITTKYFLAHPRELKTQKLILHRNFALVTKVLRGESASYDLVGCCVTIVLVLRHDFVLYRLA